MGIKWQPGPPPGRGQWWVVWQGVVMPIEVSPALIYRDDSDAKLLLKTLGGVAFDFGLQGKHITHHAVLESPESP